MHPKFGFQILHFSILNVPTLVSKMAEKRKLKTLSLKRKMNLIRKVESNPFKKQKLIADEFNIPCNTLTTIMRDSQEYKRLYFTSETDATKQRVRQAKHQNIDQAVLGWCTSAGSADVLISGPLLKPKAEEFSQKLGIPGWRCNDGWLSGFKRRRAIVFRTMCGERHSVDEDRLFKVEEIRPRAS